MFPFSKERSKEGQKSKMTGWGEDKDSKSEAEIQRYKLLLFFLIPCLLYFFLSQWCGSLLWDGNCGSDCPPWKSRKIQFHRYTRWIERWGRRKKNSIGKKKGEIEIWRRKIAQNLKSQRREKKDANGRKSMKGTKPREGGGQARWLLNMRLFYRRAGIEWKCDKYIDIVFRSCLVAVASLSYSTSSRGRGLRCRGARWWPVTASPTDEWPCWIETDV